MSRKSQLEKFEARRAKARMDENVVAEGEIKASTLQETGKKVANEYGMSTEDIFMIIARDSVKAFVTMWENSTRNTVQETIRTEMATMVREAVREEMVAAFTGIVKGIMPAQDEIVKNIVKDEIKQATAEVAATVQEQINPIIKQQSVTKEKRKPGPKRARTTPAQFYEELKYALLEYKEEGGDPTVGTPFKKSSSRNNGLYQKFNKLNAGQKGAWKTYVEKVLAGEV